MRRRLLMAMGMEEDEVKVKKYTYTPNASVTKLNIPLDFEPDTVILYDNYPNDFYTENGSVNYESNTDLPLLLKDEKYNYIVIPYSDTSSSLSYDGTKFNVSHDSGILNIDITNTYKKLISGHTYTIILIGKIESEILT